MPLQRELRILCGQSSDGPAKILDEAELGGFRLYPSSPAPE
jgi:hypothetical protein